MMPQEKRKWQTEMENKKRQLEDDRRALQHLKVRFSSRSWTLEAWTLRSPGHIVDSEDRWSERGVMVGSHDGFKVSLTRVEVKGLRLSSFLRT